MEHRVGPDMRHIERPSRSRLGSFALFACTVFLSGTQTVDKYLGARWILPYFVASVALLWVGGLLEPWFRRRPTLTWWLAVTAYVAVVVAVLIVYPIANVQVPGRGSDNDDALDITTRALVALRYPYNQSTYLGNPPVTMPGEMLLAVPFVLMGGGAYQIFFWLPVAFIGIAHLGRSPSKALCLLGPAMIASPTVIRGLVAGSDHLPNSIIVFTAFILAIMSFDASVATWKRILAFAFFGVASVTRPNFAFLIIVLVGVGLKRAGWRTAALAALLVGGTAVLVTVPFYAVNPAGFGPLVTARKVNVIPYGQLVVPGAATLVAFAVALWSKTSLRSALRGAFLVAATPIVPVALFAVARSGDWAVSVYVDLLIVFAIGAYGLDWLREAPGNAEPVVRSGTGA